ncbi:prolyl aminopeptidase [Candidatus Phycosocius spiralis]|uniref:Proline iminopeptidase n=1 Tax=Candidatus Phycosocius spiralis TaxID=2815099 RepID=A0ABQ4PYS2_9PROT|nr:prolyl aminopeptidase [Candidatus Phycosocius spiralis]GIU68076.1 proline iminopeptidase [Candidatus Phycosocius spiralis]
MPKAASKRRVLYPQIEPYKTGFLPVSDLHTLFFEQAGNPDGIPVLCLHGGPGGGMSPDMRRFFDPNTWHIIGFDQRGCGKSTPYAEIKDNTTWDLVADIEKLRIHLGIKTWAVFGGSWGSTLALAYAIKHSERVKSLTLRGIFLITRAEIQWFYQNGANHLFPDSFEHYVQIIPPEERDDIVGAFNRRLFCDDRPTRLAAARAWARWEGDCLSLQGPGARPTRFDEDRFVEAFARIENHYFKHHGFFETDGWILDHVGVLKAIPVHIVHGRYDVLTPLSSAWALKKVLPHASLEIVGDAGHASLEPGIVDALVRIGEHLIATFEGKDTSG